MSLTVQQILREHFEAFAANRQLPSNILRTARQMRACRTAALGGHVNYCPEGHFQDIAYNSCRQRVCPQCNAFPRAKWLAAWEQRLLRVAHHHIVFTTPHDLNPLWQHNKRLFCELLFRAVADSLTELLSDPEFLGARPGILAALHTWNQQLLTHIHIHAIVTAGGLDAGGAWHKATRACLLPRQVLMIKFRGKFRAFLLEHLAQFQLPPATTRLHWRNQLNRLGRLPWNVKLMERYEHGRGVINYLARYLRGGPIGNQRLLGEADGKIAFRYRLPADHGQRAGHGVLRLHPHEFLKRLLQHVPPSGLRTVRGYGLYSGNQHSGLGRAHQELGSPQPERPVVRLSVESFLSKLGIVSPKCCPQCGKPLQKYEFASERRRTHLAARSPPTGPDRNLSIQVPA